MVTEYTLQQSLREVERADQAFDQYINQFIPTSWAGRILRRPPKLFNHEELERIEGLKKMKQKKADDYRKIFQEWSFANQGE